MAGGVVLLALGVWLVTDAVIGGAGHTPWLALAGLLFAAPLVVAFTLRPAVFAGDHRLGCATRSARSRCRGAPSRRSAPGIPAR